VSIKLKEKLKPHNHDGIVIAISPNDSFELYEVD
jgi:hypothetical protein